jgi:hypothetical protein
MLEISIGTHQVYRCVNRGEGKDLTEGKQQIAAHDQGEEKPLTRRRLADLATDMRCSGEQFRKPQKGSFRGRASCSIKALNASAPPVQLRGRKLLQ